MTEPAAEEFRELIELHDRTFQNYSVQRSIYLVPVDEAEEDRLILQHEIILQMFGNRLFFPPIRHPRRVLDCGYGRGSWAVAMAERYEDCEVTAIDVYPAELPEAPDNLECEVWNLNEPLIPTYRAGQYDLIHSRCVGPGIEKDRWPAYIRELKSLLKRGGWVQCAEFYYNIQSDSGRLKDTHELYRWGQGYRAAMDRDKDPRVGRTLGDKLIQAGFTEVQSRTYQVPIGDWPADARQKVIGTSNRENIEEMLESHAILPFTQRLGWTTEQVGWMVEGAKVEMQDQRLKLYIPLWVRFVGQALIMIKDYDNSLMRYAAKEGGSECN